MVFLNVKKRIGFMDIFYSATQSGCGSVDITDCRCRPVLHTSRTCNDHTGASMHGVDKCSKEDTQMDRRHRPLRLLFVKRLAFPAQGSAQADD